MGRVVIGSTHLESFAGKEVDREVQAARQFLLEVAVLRGLVLQMHKHLADTSRSGRFPSDVARNLPRDQKAQLDLLLDGR